MQFMANYYHSTLDSHNELLSQWPPEGIIEQSQWLKIIRQTRDSSELAFYIQRQKRCQWIDLSSASRDDFSNEPQ